MAKSNIHKNWENWLKQPKPKAQENVAMQIMQHFGSDKKGYTSFLNTYKALALKMKTLGVDPKILWSNKPLWSSAIADWKKAGSPNTQKIKEMLNRAKSVKSKPAKHQRNRRQQSGREAFNRSKQQIKDKADQAAAQAHFQEGLKADQAAQKTEQAPQKTEQDITNVTGRWPVGLQSSGSSSVSDKLIKLSNYLDSKGFISEANYIDRINFNMKK